jgi:hypothetical protein
MQENQNETEVRTEPIIGKFKTKRNFLNFISAVNGSRIRFIRDIAFIKGEKLSGVLEGVIFKVTICDEGTINFEEQRGSNLADDAMIKRLISDIDERDVTGYTQKFIVSGLEFNDIDGNLCYLEVEHQKPINKLKSLFEEDKKLEVSQKSLSLLDDLFGSSDDEVQEEWDEDHALSEVMNSMLDDLSEEDVKTIIETNEKPVAAESYIEQQFRKMNESKIIELEYRIEETQKEIIRFKNDAKSAEKKAEEKSEALGVLETRLETMKPGDEPNGYVFFVSEEMKDMDSLSEEETKIALKISEIMKLKGDVIVKMLTEGYYKIKIAKADDITNRDFELEKEVYQKIAILDIDGSMKLIKEYPSNEPSGFEYRGKLNWHQLVSKMIRLGFTQEPEFDKLCNSNSYESHEEEKEENISDIDKKLKKLGFDIQIGVDESKSVNSEEIETKKLTSYSKPTDFVILGCDYDGRDIEITDDYSTLEIWVEGKPNFRVETEGHVSIISVDRYKQWIKEWSEDCGDAVDAVLVSGYQGDIMVGAQLEDGTFSTDFNFDDYIHHQLDDYADVFINFPSGTQINPIKKHDLNSLLN